MPRRIHIPRLTAGPHQLDPANSHYLRDVLRLKTDAPIEIFDDAGQSAQARILSIDHEMVTLEIAQPMLPERSSIWAIASAIPKGNRADWMIEKLCELGAARWMPLQTQRSVVHPGGESKWQRWNRIAAEAARQSGRNAVMQIDPMTTPPEIFRTHFLSPTKAPVGLFLDTAASATPILTALENRPTESHLIFFVGPEGGWSEDERSQFQQAGVAPVRLGPTILRVETAVLAVASVASVTL